MTHALKTPLLALLLATSLAACTTGSPGPVGAGRTVGAAIDDTSIRLALTRDLGSSLPNFVTEIATEVREGRVLLAGAVRTPEERLEASRIAWQIRGVHEVVNELQVRESKGLLNYAKDTRISNQLRLRLVSAAGVTTRNFNIETVNATVYILGIAKNRAELEHVAYLAATIAGVERVVSHALLANDPRRTGAPQRTAAAQFN